MSNHTEASKALRYAALSADELREQNPAKLAEIAESKKAIEAALGMTPEAIIDKARSLAIRD